MTAPRALILVVFASSACASLSPAAMKIKQSTKVETANCRFIQVVYGGPSLTPKNDALENAARVHATHIVQLYDQDQKYTADAFDCDHPKNPSPFVEAKSTTPAPAVTEAAPMRPPPVKRATSDWVIAVMEVENRIPSNDTVSSGLLQNLGDQLRVFIAQKGLRTIDRGAQDKALRDSIEQAKKESYKTCYDNTCQIELGKALAASHILRSQITRFGKSCVLNAELIDLKAEVTISATSSRGTCEEEGFLEMSERVAANLTAP